MLFTVVEKLGHEQMLDLVWYGVGRVIYSDVVQRTFRRTWTPKLTSKIWSGFVRARGSTRGLPTGNVHRLEVFRHLGYLYRIKTANV